MKKLLVKAKKYSPLTTKDLRWNCDPNIFNFESTESIDPIEGIIGQERALKALKMGIEINAPGYNIFVTGLSGTGKATTIQKILERINPDCPPLNDYAYVNNFISVDNPRLLVFPAGKAQAFAATMDSMLEFLLVKIPEVLESDAFTQKRNSILAEFSEKEKQIMANFEKKIKANGFTLGQVQMGNYYRPEVLPVIDSQPVPIQEINQVIQKNKIDEQQADLIVKQYQTYTIELQDIFKKGMQLSQEYQEKTLKLEQETVSIIINGAIMDAEEKFNIPKVHEYLEEVKSSLLNSLEIFKQYSKTKNNENPELKDSIDAALRQYKVNVILDNSSTKSCPVLIETSPTYQNIFGSIEKTYTTQGFWYADFLSIRPGSLLKANGGYLVLNALDLITEPGVWKTLKRALLYRKLEIQDNVGYYQMYTSSLKPESIEMNTKIIFLGSYEIYGLLSNYEEDFKKIFKVRADFDYEMKNSVKSLQDMARLVKKLCKEEQLLDFDKTAIAELAEYSAEYVGNKNKLTTRFAVIADIVRESVYWAKDNGSNLVYDTHVKQTIENKIQRHNLSDQKIEEMILDNTLIIDTKEEKVGEINGLAVYGSEEIYFGKPSKITATVSVGGGGIINIEREANLSGKTHDKGILILSSLLREKFASDKKISFTASICFEQSYSGVDGDSASSTEIYVILSALSNIPIKQSIAVTGSVNQKGLIQPIGGVNEKITGFFKICKKRGLDGSNGVIIPHQNINDLMLSYEILDAVEKKLFSIYAVKTIDEGIEILTGIKAGKKINNNWEKGTVYYEVNRKLIELTKLSNGSAEKSKTKRKTTRKKSRK